MIILSNGEELTPIMVTGEKRDVHGAYRDVLCFVFDDTKSLTELDAVFTEENCESITIKENSEEYIHNGYVIRAGLEKSLVKQESTDGTPVYVNRVFVRMAQRTYDETKLKDVQDTVDALVLDSLLGA